MLQGTTKGFNISKTSRINLIDLAGLDKDEVDDGEPMSKGKQICR